MNPQIIAALLGVEVRKHHLDRGAISHCDAPVTVFVIGVIVRVEGAPKLTRVLLTDGRWATCRESTCELRIASCLACVYRVMDALRKLGENERSVTR